MAVLFTESFEVKDTPRESPTSPLAPTSPYSTTKPPAAPTSPLQPSAPPPKPQDYRALLIKHRKTQLQNTRENLNRLAQTYDRAANVILERVRALPDAVERTGTGWLKAQFDLIQSIRVEMERLKNDYGNLIDAFMLSSAQDAANREAEVAQLVGVSPQGNLFPEFTRQVSLTDGVTVGVQYSRLAADAVEGVANRYYRDGLKLSDRLYKLSVDTQKTIEDTIIKGIQAGTSARDMATELQAVMSADGVQTPRYNAMRIARTEIANAHREAHVRSTVDPGTENLKSYIQGVGWRLSNSHKEPDICDIWAEHDEGLGEGVYLPGEVPVDHPHGLCTTISVLKAFPEVGLPGTKPNVADVPQSQIDYYARLGDKPSLALLAKATT